MSIPRYQEDLQAILNRYRAGKATYAEERFIEQYEQLFDNQERLSTEMTNAERQEWEAALTSDMEQKLKDWGTTYAARGKAVNVFKMLSWAAAVLLFIIGAWWIGRYSNQNQTKQIAVLNDVLPGKQRATLTLADGRKVVIEKDSAGLLVMQGAMQVMNKNGSLVYNGKSDVGALQYNMLSTAKGEQSGVKLADGTVVYLDAATEIRYPVAFSGDERVVEIREGQAYFEVAHDGRPFYVKKGRQVIEVLGTVFNIMAYSNEDFMGVTLVSGKVKVTNRDKYVQMLPGHQALLSNKNSTVTVDQHADIAQAIAWRNGQFSFHGVTFDVLIRQIERWYNVEVEIRGSLPEGTFFYDGRRNGNLSELLRAFELNQIQYKLDAVNKRLIVNP